MKEFIIATTLYVDEWHHLVQSLLVKYSKHLDLGINHFLSKSVVQVLLYGNNKGIEQIKLIQYIRSLTIPEPDWVLRNLLPAM